MNPSTLTAWRLSLMNMETPFPSNQPTSYSRAAKLLGVTHAAIVRWEDGSRKIPLSIGRLICLYELLPLSTFPWPLRLEQIAKEPPLTAEALKHFRFTLDLSQRCLAPALGVNPDTWQRWETTAKQIPRRIGLLVRLLEYQFEDSPPQHLSREEREQGIEANPGARERFRAVCVDKTPSIREIDHPDAKPTKKMMDQEKQLIAGFLENTSIAD